MKNSKRWLALIVIAVLAISILPVASFADTGKIEKAAQGIAKVANKVIDTVQNSQQAQGWANTVSKAMQSGISGMSGGNEGVVVDVINSFGNEGLFGMSIGANGNEGVGFGMFGSNGNEGVAANVIGANGNEGVVLNGHDNAGNEGVVVGSHNYGNEGLVLGCMHAGEEGVALDLCHMIPTYVPEVPATDDEPGMKEHYVCPKCGDTFIKCEGCGGIPYFKYVPAEEFVIPALGHEWGPTTYTWSPDHTECTATRKCNRCGKVESETVKAVITEKDGVKTYTADFEAPWAETQVYTEKVSNPSTPTVVPSTGDDSNTTLYVVMAGVAAALVGALMVVSKKKVR